MLDLVLLSLVLLLTALAIVYGNGCEELLSHDSTRDAAPETPTGS